MVLLRFASGVHATAPEMAAFRHFGRPALNVNDVPKDGDSTQVRMKSGYVQEPGSRLKH